MKKKDAEVYKKKLLKEKERLFLNLQSMDKTSLHATSQEGSGNLSGYVSHQADIATDIYEQEKSLSFMGNEEFLLEEIEDALQKIDKNKYGKCEICGIEIPVKRLSVEPYAKLCMECKKGEEEKKKSSDAYGSLQKNTRKRRGA